jgi:hypothetical protein
MEISCGISGLQGSNRLTFSSKSSILRSISRIGLSLPLKCSAMTKVPGVGEVTMKKIFCRLIKFASGLNHLDDGSHAFS